MRSSATRAPALGLILVALARPVWGAEPGPPDAAVPNASYPAASIGFPNAAIGYPTAAIGFPVAAVAFNSAPVATTGGAVAAPSAGLPSGGMTMTEEKAGIRFTLNADLLFDFDKANIRPAADAVLKDLVAQVQAKVPGGRFRVEGHTDAKGNDRYNDSLSNRRAASVKAWLVKNGAIPAARITTTGYGKRRPVAPNQKPDGSDDPEGRQKNRRVEILVVRP